MVSVAVFLIMATLTVLSIRHDARWLGNAYLIPLCVLLLIPALTATATPLAALLGIVTIILLGLAPLGAVVLVVFLIVNGVTMIRKEGTGLSHLLSLFLGIGLAVAMGLAIFAVTRSEYSWIHALAAAVILTVGYFGSLLACYLLYAWVYSRIARRVPAEQVVVLGAGLRDGETVGPLLASRVDRGLEQYRALREKGLDTVLVMSGGKGSDERLSEAQAMANYAMSHGVPSEHVLLEDRSRNTLQNLTYSKELITHAQSSSPQTGAALVAPASSNRGVDLFEPQQPTVLVVTSDFHALRTATYARKVGLNAQVLGAPTARYYWPSAMLREFVAIVNERKVKHLVLWALVAVPLPVMMLLSSL